jgi:superfamily II DNA or RNA helicase
MVNKGLYVAHYQSQDAETRLIIDILAYYLYPVDRFTLIDASQLSAEQFNDRVEHLTSLGLLHINTAGNYFLPPELSFLRFPEAVHLKLPIRQHAFYSSYAHLQELQQLLIAYFTGDRSLLDLPIRKISANLGDYLPYISYLLFYPAYEGLLKRFDTEVLLQLYAAAVKHQLPGLPPLADLEKFQQHMAGFLLVEDLTDHEAVFMSGQLKPTEDAFVNAALLLYDGQPLLAMAAFEKAVKKKHTLPASPFYAFLYAFTLAILPDEKAYPTIVKLVAAYEKKMSPPLTPALALLHFHHGRKERAEYMLQILLENSAQQSGRHLYSYLAILCLQLFHPNSKLLKKYNPLAKWLVNRCLENGYRLLAYEYFAAVKGEKADTSTLFTELQSFIGKPPVSSRLERTAEWERLLNTLLQDEKSSSTFAATHASRLAYLIDTQNFGVQPVLQTLLPDGWNKGLPLPLKRLQDGKVDAMTLQDQRIANTITKVSYQTYGTDTYTFEDSVWTELSGHPYLFLATAPDKTVEVMNSAPELIVNRTGKGYTFTTNVDDYSKEITLIRETETRIKVLRLDARQRAMLQTLKQIDIVPEAGKDKLLQALAHIGAHITVHSNLEEEKLNIQQRPADARILVQLLPVGNALKATLYVKPFVTEAPYCKPGQGARNIIGVVNGERCQTTRDLELETNNATLLVTLIQEAVNQEIDDDTIAFDDPVDCLRLLEVVRNHPELALTEWPQGEKLRIRYQAPVSRLHITARVNGKWFECNGELRVDNNTVLSLRELLQVTQHSPSRFISLKDGEFLALSNQLYRRLQELASIAITETNTVKIQPLSAHMLDELMEDAGSAEMDEAWKALRKKWKDAVTITPPIPTTLQATLRPYQEDGFRWLVQLAALGAGACLADDMGLGKTIQAITLLLHRATEGPALIVCPASVVPNWINEINRFAPSLQIHTLNGDRYQTVKSAAGFDVLIITYGLLQTEAQLLASHHWHTVVLDEAHTIKNYQTRTSKAAMGLDAGFKVILTGTPLQNQLREIWNLFQFINPGLLGSLHHFNKMFATPVIYNPESTVRKHLKKLIAPFMLRRTKAMVLDELPPKTDILKMVDLTEDEAAFYEAIRQQAVENIKRYGGHQHKQNLNTLTEIGKMRMAACNPQLINSNIDIPSSKLAVFMDVVEELIAGNHRALVFSQFVKHLDLVRKALDAKGIPYLYLDGATSIPAREKLVKDFQSGQGDLFLISLKAGGQGLNLTAADYVIHLDPWWNPAIEEQASDRAYRIGQTRPVTIYRLVARHTIEEKIIALHHNKRDLAEQLLEGSDLPAKLSAEELMELITKN